ncbi:MAG: Holliday junction resolvase RuvX [Phycisphaeraceae bacterium]
MRYLCIDLGDKRTGLAVGDDITDIVTPLEVIQATSDEQRLTAMGSAIIEQEPGELVLGLPLNMDDSEGPAAKKGRAFAALLEARFGLRVHLADERLTSYAVEKEMGPMELTRGKKKERRDALAAAMILRDFLSRRDKT